MKWNYVLNVPLRDAIHSGDAIKVIDVLKDAYFELMDAGILDRSEYETLEEDLGLYGDDVEDEDADFELTEFYDLCDSAGVWIPLA